MKINVFSHTHYKTYIKAALENHPESRRGINKALAEFIGVQPSYLSLVLKSSSHLNLEQAEQVNLFFKHSKEESHFFLLLVQRDRAGSPTLVKYFEEQISEILKKQHDLIKQIQAKSKVSDKDQEVFYSSWQYSAVQIATSISSLQQKDKIAQKLGLSVERVTEILSFLLGAGLVVQQDSRYQMGTQSTHLGAKSPLISQHHANWRIRTMQRLADQSPDDLHYSTVMSLSLSATKQIKSLLVDSIKSANEIMEKSKEEELFCLALDWYDL